MIKGLTQEQVDKRLKKYGFNEVKTEGRRSAAELFFSQFKNFFIYLLFGASAISFVVGEVFDGFLILAIIFLNAFFGFYQEWKADEAAESLKNLMVFKVRVIRDGKEQEIDSKYLVPGDIVFLEEGVRIPADGKIVDTNVLEVNEAVLTGESLAVSKSAGDRVFMGTLVTKGHGLMKVETTGMSTYFGKIAEKLSSVEKEKSPLEKKLKDLSKKIGVIGAFVSIIVLLVGYIKGLGILESLLLSVSLAVAVIPEGLPAVMTMTLAIGVREMAKRKAIVRRLSSIETLGSITLIATDKTGTLTTNQMRVKSLFVDGVEGGAKQSPKAKELLMLNSVLCSTASLVFSPGGEVDYIGDPTEGAILLYAKENGLDPQKTREKWEYVKEEPFDSAKKIMSVKVKEKDTKKVYFFSKGAPEVILSNVNKAFIKGKVVVFDNKIKEKVFSVIDKWTAKGYRVLGFSFGKDKPDIFLGLVALHDPPRPEVKEALEKAKRAGIKTVMITGDNEKTAASIGMAVGLLDKNDEILTGEQLEKYTDEELLRVLPKVKAFARTTPFHKLRIVKLYQKLGEIVAVTGDGVNDSIALKQADVGVAMGKVGTDVARESADVIVTDDNYATIVEAVEQGRNITKNIKNAIFYLLSCNTGEVFSILFSLLLGFARLFTPVQILFINLVTDGIPALALAFSPTEKGIMSKSPERKLTLIPTARFLKIVYIGAVSGFIVLLTLFLVKNGYSLEWERGVAFSTLVFVQTFIFAYVWFNEKLLIKFSKEYFKPIFLIAFFFPIIIQYVILTTKLAYIFKSSILTPTTFVYTLLYSAGVLVFLGIGSKINLKCQNSKPKSTT